MKITPQTNGAAPQNICIAFAQVYHGIVTPKGIHCPAWPSAGDIRAMQANPALLPAPVLPRGHRNDPKYCADWQVGLWWDGPSPPPD